MVPGMPSGASVTPGGLVYHVLNRSVAGLPLFRKRADYEALERIMIQAHGRRPLPVLACCLMRTHWHFVVWPRRRKSSGFGRASPEASLTGAKTGEAGRPKIWDGGTRCAAKVGRRSRRSIRKTSCVPVSTLEP